MSRVAARRPRRRASSSAPWRLSSRAAGRAPAPAFPALIPQPLAQAPERGTFALGPEARVVVRSRARDAVRVGELLARSLRPATGYRLPVVATRPVAGDVTLALVPGDTALGDEGYRLHVDGAGVTSRPGAPRASSGARRRCASSCPPRSRPTAGGPGPWLVPRGTIHDRPRFAWRGAMLDVARHFFGVDDVRRLVDLMSLYKLNRLHLHLTDDQGWRLAIRSWPRLTSHGGRTQVGGGRGGYFTQRQYAALVAYAAGRFVEVVPEIDMPGHVNAALSSYAKLNCDGLAPAPYTGIEVGFSSLCLRKPVTYAFVDDVVREVAALTPGRYMHIGGDEAHATDPAEYRTFVERVDRIVRAHGKRMMGWEEIGKTRLRRRPSCSTGDGRLRRARSRRARRLMMSPARRRTST